MRLFCYWRWISSYHCQSSLRIHSAIASWIHNYFNNVMTKFMINNRTDLEAYHLSSILPALFERCPGVFFSVHECPRLDIAEQSSVFKDRLLTFLYFFVFQSKSTFQRAEKIARELGASAKERLDGVGSQYRKIYSSIGSLHSPPHSHPLCFSFASIAFSCACVENYRGCGQSSVKI